MGRVCAGVTCDGGWRAGAGERAGAGAGRGRGGGLHPAAGGCGGGRGRRAPVRAFPGGTPRARRRAACTLQLQSRSCRACETELAGVSATSGGSFHRRAQRGAPGPPPRLRRGGGVLSFLLSQAPDAVHPGVYPGVYPGAQAGLRELLRGLGLPARALPGPLLRLRREVSSAGAGGGVRSRCFVNGAATPLRVLREVGAALVDVNGQHAAQTLRRAPAAPATPCRRAALLDRSSARQGS